MYGFQSYISVPTKLPDGSFFGTLCAINPRPKQVNTPAATGMFKLFAELIALHINAHQRLASSAAILDQERAGSELRKQFIAVLGHDLRNPLASIDAGAKMLSKESLAERGRTILSLVEKSVGRMAGLIDDVLDFARGRLGGGIRVESEDRVPLAPMLRQVIGELQESHPDRVIEVDLDGITDCRCDPARIGQVLSNLLANALAHGSPDAPVGVRGHVDEDGSMTLAVLNAGEAIPPERTPDLFQPFVRASVKPHQQDLGLGLYIASEIAKAHGGVLDATSSPNETTFTFRMPGQPAGPEPR